MRVWLREAFGDDSVLWGNALQLQQLIESKGPSYLDRFKVIGGHFQYNFPVIDCLTGPFVRCAVVRRPLDHVISHFEWVSRRPQHPLYCDKSLESALTTNTKFRKTSTNGQCRYVGGSNSAKKAVSRVNGEDYIVGCFDFLSDFIEAVTEMFELRNISLNQSNSQADGYFDHHYSSDVERLIDSITVEDDALYNSVRQIRVKKNGHNLPIY